MKIYRLFNIYIIKGDYMFEILNTLIDNFMFLILYISNGSSFPKPLTDKEEQYYLELFQSGDKYAKNILIERNLRLVAHVIKKYYSNTSDQDDLISIGTIGLIKGITSYKPTKGTKLATYAARCIENEILMHFRSQKKNQNETLISSPIEIDDDGNSLTYMDIVSEEDDLAENIDLKANARKLYNYIEELPKREQTILILRYGLYNTKSMTQKEIAKKLGISRSYVSRIEKKAVDKLKDKFNSRGV